MTLDQNLDIVATAFQAVVIGLLVVRKIFRKLPLFSSYVVWLFLILGITTVASKFYSSRFSSDNIFLWASIIDMVFMLSVLVELSMSVLSPIRASLSRWTAPVIGLLLAIAFAIAWPFAKPPGFGDMVSTSQYIVRLDLTASILRIAFFLGLAACSQLLSIGWRDRELQVATGLGFYSFISLSASLLQMNLGTSVETVQKYQLLNEVPVAGYVLCSIYWIVSFAQKVPERREFTPQMEQFLLAVAGNARTARVGLRNSSEFKKKNTDDKD